MKDLRQLQEDFKAYLIDKRQSAIEADIVSDEKADVAERMGFYHDAYRLRLIEVLSLDYPVVAKYLGEEAFGGMAMAYLRKHPSKYKSIRWFGTHLPEFLSTNDKDKEQGEQLLELVRFEKAQNDVFDGPQSNVVTIDELAAISPVDWENILINFIPASQTLSLNTNAVSVWLELYHRQDDTIEPQSADWESQEYPVSWLVWRGGLDPKWRALEVDEAWAIESFHRGHTFGQVCAGLTEWIDEEHVPMRAVSILKTLIIDEVISTIHVSEK